eukprot:13520104-Alexandrium_andersonii.AAC.1
MKQLALLRTASAILNVRVGHASSRCACAKPDHPEAWARSNLGARAGSEQGARACAKRTVAQQTATLRADGV